MSKYLRVCSLLICWGIWSVGALHACDCVQLSTSTAFQQADIAFVGKVVQVNTNWISGGWKYTFEVEQSWKRSAGRLLIVNTGAKNSSCAYPFEADKRYLVFADKGFGYKSDRCMGNQNLDSTYLHVDVFGKAMLPQQNEALESMYWTVGILGLLSVLFMAAIVLRAWRRRKDIHNT